jgi:hypothetical protein
VHRLADVIESGDEADFGALQTQLGALLGDDAGHYRELCAELFATARPPVAPQPATPLAVSADPQQKGSTA